MLRLQAAGRPLPRRMPHGLPLATLTALRPHAASLERMGCRTWGAVRALPRDGAARRFGAEPLRALDQAWGDVPHLLPWLELPEHFELPAELPAPATSAEQLLWTANRLLGALRDWLQARHRGVLALELSWRHDLRRLDGQDLPPGDHLAVRTAEATQDLAHLRRLLAEHLARRPLAAPVNRLVLRAADTAALPQASESLLPPGTEEGGGGRGLAPVGGADVRPLGAGQVRVPVLQADHRPERMQRWEAAARNLPRRPRGQPADRRQGAGPAAAPLRGRGHLRRRRLLAGLAGASAPAPGPAGRPPLPAGAAAPAGRAPPVRRRLVGWRHGAAGLFRGVERRRGYGLDLPAMAGGRRERAPAMVLARGVCMSAEPLPEPAEGAAAASGLPGYAELHCLSNFSFQRGPRTPSNSWSARPSSAMRRWL